MVCRIGRLLCNISEDNNADNGALVFDCLDSLKD